MASSWRVRCMLQSTDDTTASTGENDTLATFSAVMSNILLFFLVFGMSATVRVDDLKHRLTNKFAIGAGVTMQFLFMPFLGFCSVMLVTNAGLTYAMGITLLVLTSSPGGLYSNWCCSLFNADLVLSVAMTSVSSILSLGLLPANLFFYSWLAYSVVLKEEEQDSNVVGALDFKAIFITLGVVLGAILSGLYVGYKHNNPHFHKRANQFGSVCGIALILFSAFLGSGTGDAETNFWSLPWSFYVATALPCIGGMTLANIVARSARLSPPEVVAISIECCYQNTAIATSVAITMFTDPDQLAEAVSVPLFYGIIEAIIIAIYCVWAWKVGWTKAPSNEKLCVVITKTYEVDDESEEEEWTGDLPSGCLARLFVPREVEQNHRAALVESDSKSVTKEGEDCPRERFESADVTLATSSTTPPGTPETTSVETSIQETTRNRLPSDLEIQTPSKSLFHATNTIDELIDDALPVEQDIPDVDFQNDEVRSSDILSKLSLVHASAKNDISSTDQETDNV